MPRGCAGAPVSVFHHAVFQRQDLQAVSVTQPEAKSLLLTPFLHKPQHPGDTTPKPAIVFPCATRRIRRASIGPGVRRHSTRCSRCCESLPQDRYASSLRLFRRRFGLSSKGLVSVKPLWKSAGDFGPRPVQLSGTIIIGTQYCVVRLIPCAGYQDFLSDMWSSRSHIANFSNYIVKSFKNYQIINILFYAGHRLW